MSQITHAVSTTIDDLDGECLRTVFSFLSVKDCSRVACVKRLWRQIVEDDEQYWAKACEADYAVEGKFGPNGTAHGRFNATYLAWQASLGRYGPLASRACHLWRRLKLWLKANIPEVAESLRPGTSEDALEAAEERLGVALPAALRALYRVQDGQGLEYEGDAFGLADMPFHPSMLHGLFGGYSFYNHKTSTRMLSLPAVVALTLRCRAVGTFRSEDHIVFGISFDFYRGCKMLQLNCQTGHVLTSQLGRLETTLAVPAAKAGSDCMLHWLERYADELERGNFAVSNMMDVDEPVIRGISLFLAAPPQQVTAVSRGVEVKASAVYVPELSNIGMHRRLFFAYSIRFALLSEEEQLRRGAAYPVQSVQLLARHWQILNERGGVENEIRGEAVVGHYPLLAAGGPDFVYQSCTQQGQAIGAMQGDFRFVEGSIARPTGPEFDVLCPKFMLQAPDYIF
ncbi:hypothetical protein WJX72_008721 [[Myrmecia] bisecta]|uniref:ApaG domain-containing protein n=1 Tax=[Myrmecia] bisecta TaxID=41462 RepID=A0AAW1PPF6_9CHLO